VGVEPCLEPECDRAAAVRGRCARCNAREWRRLNRGRDRANAAAYRAAHLEKARASVRRCFADRKEDYARSRDPAKKRAANKRWLERNPQKAQEYRHKVRAKRGSAVGWHTGEEWSDLCALYGDRCPRCMQPCRRFTVDHITPLSRGGTDYVWNLQPLCARCNCQKSNKPEGFYPPACFQR
jgi:5-methylcytosine-specific restriction endonuclease McrA